jgi:hypothetical protein
MVLTQTISVDYKSYDDLLFSALTKGINLNLGAGRYKACPDPTPDEYDLLIIDFDKAVQVVASGLKSGTLERNRTRKLLEAGSRRLSGYAEGITPDRPDWWREAGFPLTKGETTPRLASQLTTNLQVKDGDARLVLLATVDRQPGMYGYLWRVRPRNAPAGRFSYETLVTREPFVYIRNLEAEVAYCIECAAWNDTGPLQWCEAVSRIVQ